MPTKYSRPRDRLVFVFIAIAPFLLSVMTDMHVFLTVYCQFGTLSLLEYFPQLECCLVSALMSMCPQRMLFYAVCCYVMIISESGHVKLCVFVFMYCHIFYLFIYSFNYTTWLYNTCVWSHICARITQLVRCAVHGSLIDVVVVISSVVAYKTRRGRKQGC